MLLLRTLSLVAMFNIQQRQQSLKLYLPGRSLSFAVHPIRCFNDPIRSNGNNKQVVFINSGVNLVHFKPACMFRMWGSLEGGMVRGSGSGKLCICLVNLN